MKTKDPKRRKMKGVTPLTSLGLDDKQLLDHCDHIISHSERYEKARVSEARELVQSERK